jgi:hypothetical protein
VASGSGGFGGGVGGAGTGVGVAWWNGLGFGFGVVSGAGVSGTVFISSRALRNCFRFSSSLVSCAPAQTLKRQTDKRRRKTTRTPRPGEMTNDD